MRVIKILINITIPIFLLMLFASLLTTKPYLMLSKGLYSTHSEITYDHEYAVERIIGYLNYRYDDLEFGIDESDDNIIMRDVEIRHMVDVKNLYTTLRIIAVVCLVVAVSLSYYLHRKNREELYKALKTLPIGPIFFIMFVGGYLIIDFNTAFRVFHELFFTNDDWLLYANDVLILLLPTNFWMVSGIIILGLFSLTLGLLYFLNEKFLKSAK